MDCWAVWEDVSLAVCWYPTGRRLQGTRWVGVKNRDKHSPDVRFRLVAQEFNTNREDSFFAATPPLESLRLLLSHVTTNRDGSHGGQRSWYSTQRRRTSMLSRSVRSISNFHPNAGSVRLASSSGAFTVRGMRSSWIAFLPSLRQWASSVGRPTHACSAKGSSWLCTETNARMSEPTEEGRHQWWRQLGLDVSQGLEPRVEVAGVEHRLRSRPSARRAAGQGLASDVRPAWMATAACSQALRRSVRSRVLNSESAACASHVEVPIDRRQQLEVIWDTDEG